MWCSLPEWGREPTHGNWGFKYEVVMTSRGVRLRLQPSDRQISGRVIATLAWPEEHDAEARAFLRDNLLAERLGDSRKADAALKRGFVPAAERGAFLADRVVFLPEPPAALSAAIDLEDLVAEFSVGLQQLRVAEPELDLVFEFISEE